jgi:hypothetical protein
MACTNSSKACKPRSLSPLSANSSSLGHTSKAGAASEHCGGAFDRVMLGGFLESAALWCLRCGNEGCKVLAHGRVGWRGWSLRFGLDFRCWRIRISRLCLRGLNENLSAIRCDDLFLLMAILGIVLSPSNCREERWTFEDYHDTEGLF